jgi:pimeloyl-ACP methyl ester carboxylesterase
MLVLTAHTFLRAAPPVPAAQQAAAQLQTLWQEMHRELMHQSSKATQILVETSGHFIQREQPEVIAAAIRQMLETVQNRP